MGKTQLYATKQMKIARESRGYTQEQMAEFLTLQVGTNISPSTYQKWEQGRKAIMPEVALELAVALKLEVKKLLERR